MTPALDNEKRFPDVSDYLVGERAEAELAAWERVKFYERHTHHVIEELSRIKGYRVVEVGIGGGWVPSFLPGYVHYLGVDKSPTFLGKAMTKNPGRSFMLADIKRFNTLSNVLTCGPFDLVYSFAVMKHFGLHEWDEIYRNIARMAHHTLIEVTIAPEDIDDGTEFHHVSVSESHLNDVITSINHEYVSHTVEFNGFLGDGVTPIQEWAVRTRYRKSS